MNIDLGRLRIQRVIAHDIPLQIPGEREQNLLFSEVESPLNQNNKNFFKERINRSLSSAAFDVIVDPETTSPVPKYIHQLISGDSQKFVKISQDISQHLYNCQNRANSEGIVVLIQATIQQSHSLVILKLEKEQGIRVHQENINGKRTFAIEQFTDLMMTDGTKVFKVGLFYNFGQTSETIQGRVSDKQRKYDVGISDFFLRKFLGCKFKEAPSITTKNFFHSTEEFINQHLSDSQAKADYTVALIATLGNQENTIDPWRFAEQNMQVADRNRYVNFVREHGIPTEKFIKDTSQIKNHIRKVQMEFKSGILIIGKPDVFNEQVQITRMGEERVRVSLEDEIKRTSGK
ncbi:MAG: nucleoid-associated protein [Elainellaceae cyanobacterium]